MIVKSFKSIPESIIKSIKIVATVFMSLALGLEIFRIYQLLNGNEIPNGLNIVIFIADFAILAHFIEAILATFYAPLKGKKAIPAGIYTFFTGTVGLLELFD